MVPSASKLTDFGPHVPEDKVQYLIQTPYGRGLTLRTRNATKDVPYMRQIELLDWKNAIEETIASQEKTGIVKPAMLYSTMDFPSVSPKVGDDVMCSFGRGKVVEILVSSQQQNDGSISNITTIAVLLSSWRLAHRSRVTCYLQPSAIRVVRPKKIYEMTVHERVEAALAFKDQAADQFTAKDYRAALQSYAKAIDAVRYVQHKADSDNYVRADLLVVMVTCSNNAGVCARQLGHWEESSNFGKNSEVLIDAVERKKGLKIHTILVKDGFHDVKLFGEWKVKSLMLQARAKAEKQELDQSMEILKKVQDVINTYSTDAYAAQYASSVKTLRNLEKDAQKLRLACKERKSLVLKKEKQRAAAMFGGSAPKVNKNGLSSHPDRALNNGVKEKENHAPNGNHKPAPVSEQSTSQMNNPKPQQQQQQQQRHIGKTLPLKDSSSSSSLADSPTENNDNGKAKRRVSFSEKVTSYEIPDKEEEKANAEEEYKRWNNKDDGLDELEWYNDQEVLLGIAIFGGAAVAASFLVNFLLRPRGS